MGYFPYGINNYFFKSTDVDRNIKSFIIFFYFSLVAPLNGWTEWVEF